ncbi:MAG: sigma-70 family RNA polymerase sigma factor, partial [Candidatus Hydrogenedentota bacterium]
EVAAWDDINEILDAELNALPDACRAVIVAHYSEGHTQVEVAERMGIPRTTVSSRIQKGLGLLERRMKSRGVVVPAAALSGMMATGMSHAAPASLAEAMGKAVLRGVFRSHARTVPMLRKVSAVGVIAGISILAFVALNRKVVEPIAEGISSPAVSAMTVEPASAAVEVEGRGLSLLLRRPMNRRKLMMRFRRLLNLYRNRRKFAFNARMTRGNRWSVCRYMYFRVTWMARP